MRNIDDLMTPEELAYDLFKGLPDYELNVNTRWLRMLFDAMRVGSIWGWPEARRTFRKVSSVHFVEVNFEEE